MSADGLRRGGLGGLSAPMIWGSAVVIAATYIGLRAWGRRARAAHDLAVDDGFSFGDAVDRMHERERATALANAERREAYARTR